MQALLKMKWILEGALGKIVQKNTKYITLN